MRDKLIIAALLLSIGGIAGWNLNRTSIPEITRITEIRERAAKADTVLVMDTVYYAKVKSVYDTLILRDTIPHWDTVWVKEYVQMADSTIRACDKALRSCLNSLAFRDTVILFQDRFIKEKPKSSKLELLGIASIGCGLGAFISSRR